MSGKSRHSSDGGTLRCSSLRERSTEPIVDRFSRGLVDVSAQACWTCRRSGVAVGVDVGVEVGVGVKLAVAVAVAVGVGVNVAVAVGVGLGGIVAVAVALGSTE